MPTVDAQGVAIHYEVEGEGPPIVLVHGFSSSYERNWRITGWTEHLTREGRQVIGLDCRGHGRSGKPHDPSAYAGFRMAEDVIAVMAAAGLDRADRMGYSMGGAISLSLMVLHPSRFRSVVIGGAGLRNAAADPQRRAVMAAGFEASDPSTITDPTALSFRRFAERSSENDLAALAALQRSDRSSADEDALRHAHHRALAVVGEKDEAVAAVDRLMKVLPRAELVVLPGEDHLSAVLAKAYKEAVSQFLGSR
ncbi:MAG: alpha/beta fold hydrolase [Chloroflexota bacterium]|nr:alpha/beta fold hydrolase [Chloroflexota bacterium]